jgi:hypothetical protein
LIKYWLKIEIWYSTGNWALKTKPDAEIQKMFLCECSVDLLLFGESDFSGYGGNEFSVDSEQIAQWAAKGGGGGLGGIFGEYLLGGKVEVMQFYGPNRAPWALRMRLRSRSILSKLDSRESDLGRDF